MPRTPLLACALFLTFPILAHPQGFTPQEALKRMQLPDGFTAKLSASEPMIRQPLSVSFDEKGRMWVLQYLQYPNPAGLKPVKQDQYLRTVWDRVPEPPPHGPKGADRVTILSDPDENGQYRKSKDFVTGLNLATGFCIGHGGVYVVQPPYLLFYPDKDGDDVPDGDPEVLLKGFGMEDSHSYANSLQWGPDGWLYGAHGSTVSANIRGIEFQQGIWRFHPITKEFELFAEGGGNTYGLDFDKFGRCIAGTNWGGKAMLHHVQGAYYVKGFAKHGPLHNAHTYGYLDHVPYEGFKGGHVTCGGIVYQGDTFPTEMQDQYIAGNLLSNAIYWHKMMPQGSSFTAKHGGDLLTSNDTWFRPVDCFLGPDGSVYIADWYDKRAAHLDPVDSWDKTNGRVYRIEYRGTKQPAPFDLKKKTSAELVELLKHPNKWWRNESRRLLAERRDKSVVETLKNLVVNEKDLLALEALWALYVSDGFDKTFGVKLLQHSNEHVRSWAVRLLGDGYKSGDECEALIELAKRETSPTVRSQLACTAKRLPSPQGPRIALELLYHAEDQSDQHIPLLIWWALEAKAAPGKVNLLDLIRDHESRGFWKQPLVRSVLLERLGRRFVSEGAAGYTLAADLLRSLPDSDGAAIAARGMAKALEGRALDKPPAELLTILSKRWADQPNSRDFLTLAVRLGSEPAYRHVQKLAADATAKDPDRIAAVELLADARKPDAIPILLTLFKEGKSETLREAALTALPGFKDEKVGAEVLTAFSSLKGKIRQKAQSILLSRPDTALAFIGLVEKGVMQPKEIPLDQLRHLSEFKDEKLTKLVEKHWGKLTRETAGEKRARVGGLNIILNMGKGDAERGKAIFTKSCAVCHTFHGEGGKVGPDLTTADRKNRMYMLENIVDPSGYIRPEFLSYNVVTADGRRLTGLVGESSAESVTLLNVVNDQVQKTVVARKDVEEMNASPLSLMPEKILDTFGDQEVRDLFAYLQLDKALPKSDAKPQAAKVKVLLISGSLEYKSDESLAEFQKYLEANYPIECTRAFRKTDDDVPGLEALDSCDVAIFFTRRLTIDGSQLERVKKYAMSGKPIIGIRTASHGFQKWLDMDKEVFGGSYKGHFGAGPKCDVAIEEKGKSHPILQGVKPFASSGSLYKNADNAKDVTVLLSGSIPKQTEPIAWVREQKGGRVFYTSLGHPDDFKEESFLRMLANAIYWTTKHEAPAKK